jgi:hypothetical protein
LTGKTVSAQVKKFFLRDEFRKMMFASDVTEDDIKSHIIFPYHVPSTPVRIDVDIFEKLFNLITGLFFTGLVAYNYTYNMKDLSYYTE